MDREPGEWVPKGAAVLPEIPVELGVHPFLLGVLHAVVFLEGSEDDIVDPDAAVEAMEYIGMYLQRLNAPELQRMREDMHTLAEFAKQEKWPKEQVRFFKEFMENFGIGVEGEE